MKEFAAYRCEGDTGAQPLHCHEDVEFVSVTQGQGILRCGRARLSTGPGVLGIVCPQEAHAGAPLAEDFVVQGLNISADWLNALHLDGHKLWRKDALCDSPSALPLFLQAYDAVTQHHARLSQEEALLALCRYTGKHPETPAVRGPERVDRAVLLLRERFAEDVSLTELAALVGLTPTSLCRAFRKSVGLPPHAYQNSLRVARAKTLLERGTLAGDVAREVGFYDQSHLTLHFKRLMGTTPAAVARGTISSYLSPSAQK